MDSFSFRPTLPARPFLLATDIDGTLLGDETGEARLRAFARQYASSFQLAYITGRYRSSVLRLVAEGRLPQPHYISSDVGTELFDCSDPENQLGGQYAAQVAPGWDLAEIYARGTGPGIRPQDFTEGQPPFQAGFLWDGDPQTLAAFRSRLSGSQAWHIYPSYGEYIDVLPRALGKGNAARFLQQMLGFDPERVVVAGDSGNDCLLFETGFQGIIPSNALEELKLAARQPWHYHSPLPAAQGVLDGLCHFGLVEKHSMEKSATADRLF